MWDIVELALKLADINCKAEATKDVVKKDIIEAEQLEEVKFKSKLAQDVQTNKGNNHKKRLTPSLLKKYVLKIKERLLQIQENIKNQIPAPAEAHEWEWQCLCARLTIYRDRWGECGETTHRRGPFLNYVDTLFILQFHIRAWSRQSKIFIIPEEGSELPVVWSTRRDFVNNGWFYVLDDDEGKDDPVIKWSPAKVYKAMNTLMRDRGMNCVTLPNKQAEMLLTEYLHALFDRLAVLIIGQATGTPEELATFHPKWFRPYDTRKAIKLDTTLGEQSYSELSKKVKESREMDLLAQRKMMELAGKEDENRAFSDMRNKIYATNRERLEDIYTTKERFDFDGMKRELARLNEKKLLLTSQLNHDDYDYEEIKIGKKKGSKWADAEAQDKEELKRIEEDIKDVQKLLKIKETEQNLRVAKENEKVNSNINELLADGTKMSQTVGVTSVCTPEYVKENMLLADHLMIWQIHPHKEIRKYDAKHDMLKDEIYREICQAILRGNETNVLADAQRWLTGKSVTFPERELYRMAYTADAVFTTNDVIRSIRGVDAAVMEGFDDIMTFLQSPGHVYHCPFLSFVVWWYLGQIMNKSNIDNSLYVADVEMEMFSFDRFNLKTHCMTQLGAIWYVLEPNKWTAEDGWINATRCGPNMLDCISLWLMKIAENGWVVYDRLEKRMVGIEKTRLGDIYKRMNEKMEKLNAVVNELNNL